jgi:hypothetical protein
MPVPPQEAGRDGSRRPAAASSHRHRIPFTCRLLTRAVLLELLACTSLDARGRCAPDPCSFT